GSASSRRRAARTRVGRAARRASRGRVGAGHARGLAARSAARRERPGQRADRERGSVQRAREDRDEAVELAALDAVGRRPRGAGEHQEERLAPLAAREALPGVRAVTEVEPLLADIAKGKSLPVYLVVGEEFLAR